MLYGSFLSKQEFKALLYSCGQMVLVTEQELNASTEHNVEEFLQFYLHKWPTK